MIHRQCKTCLFGELCWCDGKCKHYFPITDEAEREWLEAIQVEEQEEYRVAWFDYIKEHQG